MTKDVVSQGCQESTSRCFRIMSFDGGPSSTTFLTCLKELVKDNPLLFSRADLFAGTSDGALLALYLASRTPEQLRDGRNIINELIRINSEFLGVFGQSKQLCRSLTGWGTLLDPKPMRDNLKKVFGDKTLADLNHYAVVVAYRLFTMTKHEIKESKSDCWFSSGSNESSIKTDNRIERPWGAQIFHNIFPKCEDFPESHGELDSTYFARLKKRYDRLYLADDSTEVHHLKLVDLVMRSGSTPLFLPIYEGFVDGAFFANNPSMAAVATVMGNRRWINYHYNRESAKTGKPVYLVKDPSNILVFSLGKDDKLFVEEEQNNKWQRTARNSVRERIKNKFTQWGYLSWMLRLKSPLLLFKLLFSKDGRGVSDQAAQILSFNNYFRLSLMKDKGFIYDFLHVILLNDMENINEDAKKLAKDWVRQSTNMDNEENSEMEAPFVQFLSQFKDEGFHKDAGEIFSQPDANFSFPVVSKKTELLRLLKEAGYSDPIPDEGMDWIWKSEELSQHFNHINFSCLLNEDIFDPPCEDLVQYMLRIMQHLGFTRTQAFGTSAVIHYTSQLLQTIASDVVSECKGEQVPVVTRIKEAVARVVDVAQTGLSEMNQSSMTLLMEKASDETLRKRIASFMLKTLQNLKNANVSDYFSNTYINTNLWMWNMWMMNDDRDPALHHLWTVVYDPYFHAPIELLMEDLDTMKLSSF